MKIIRNGQEFELTGLECHQAYEEIQKEYYMDDIGNKVREDYDIEPCTDDSVIDLEEIATDAQDLLANDDCYYECYWDAIHTAIKQYLKEKGLK